MVDKIKIVDATHQIEDLIVDFHEKIEEDENNEELLILVEKLREDVENFRFNLFEYLNVE
tara:strand:- start:134 stop:313 length:180 start_codon:yes stop_codon:yes gene_type:complete